MRNYGIHVPIYAMAYPFMHRKTIYAILRFFCTHLCEFLMKSPPSAQESRSRVAPVGENNGAS